MITERLKQLLHISPELTECPQFNSILTPGHLGAKVTPSVPVTITARVLPGEEGAN